MCTVKSGRGEGRGCIMCYDAHDCILYIYMYCTYCNLYIFLSVYAVYCTDLYCLYVFLQQFIQQTQDHQGEKTA